MTLAKLVEAIAAEVRVAVAELKLPVEYQDDEEREAETTWQKINVWEQYIPKDLFENTVYFPCAIVELVEVHDDTKEGSRATIGISCGVFAKEADGWKDAFHLMELIRDRLLTVRTVARNFRLTGELTWQPAQTQPTPFFFTYGEATYQVFQTQEAFPLERELPADLAEVATKKQPKVVNFKRRL